jgi:hypothetical protein
MVARAGELDRLAGPWVARPDRLEQLEHVLGARRRPQREEVVVAVGEGPAATDRHEPRVPDLREDGGRGS